MFEVRATDLAARIGRLGTKSGILETPALLPVVHPVRQTIPPRDLMKMGFQAVMTNAYLTLKHYGDSAMERGIHRVIDFDGIIMTDSGGYQILEYGKVETDPLEMVRFEEGIGTDIAIILDQPTGLNVDRRFAEATVEATLKAAQASVDARKKKDILWTGAIQGGRFLDLIQKSAGKLSHLDFNLYALGSPTEVMKAYDFRLLAEMIVTAKRNLPPDMPLHLFGAGHPLTIPLAVALGCDLFDSASYVLYAKAGRYLTGAGTSRLDRLTTLPCSCPVCSKYTIGELKAEDVDERLNLVATHNLYVLLEEVKATKQAIVDGRLWEHLDVKAQCHPKLWDAFNIFRDLVEYLEDGTPVLKQRAAFLTNTLDQHRPEMARYRQRLLEDVSVPSSKNMLLILPETEIKPLYETELYQSLEATLGRDLGSIQVCFLSLPLGLIPVELSDIYPLSQHLASRDTAPDVEDLAEQAAQFVRKRTYRRVIIVDASTRHRPLMRDIKRILAKPTLIHVQDDAEASVVAKKIKNSIQKT